MDEMEDKSKSKILAASLIKEYLASHEHFSATLASFNLENRQNCLSSRKELAKALNIPKQVKISSKQSILKFNKTRYHSLKFLSTSIFKTRKR
jgi:hypothetical protein